MTQGARLVGNQFAKSLLHIVINNLKLPFESSMPAEPLGKIPLDWPPLVPAKYKICSKLKKN
jgi:hypothetical protein